MKKLEVSMIALALLAGLASAGVTVNGVINPEEGYTIIADPDNDCDGAEMVRWGYVLDQAGGMVYGFIELDTTISSYSKIWASFQFNTDLSNSTELTNLETEVVGSGIDIGAEYGTTDGFNYWGAGGDWWNQGPAISGSVAISGCVIEMSAPIAEIGGYAYGFDGAIPGPVWSIAPRIAKEGGAGTDYVADYGSFVSVPEPVTMGLLAIGGLALLRRRK